MLLIYLCIWLPTQLHAFLCSAYCGVNQCSGSTSSDCTGCDSPFALTGSSCNINGTSGYKLVAEQADFTLAPTKNGQTCGLYSMEGYYSNSDP